jgi:hypothetical protein
VIKFVVVASYSFPMFLRNKSAVRHPLGMENYIRLIANKRLTQHQLVSAGPAALWALLLAAGCREPDGQIDIASTSNRLILLTAEARQSGLTVAEMGDVGPLPLLLDAGDEDSETIVVSRGPTRTNVVIPLNHIAVIERNVTNVFELGVDVDDSRLRIVADDSTAQRVASELQAELTFDNGWLLHREGLLLDSGFAWGKGIQESSLVMSADPSSVIGAQSIGTMTIAPQQIAKISSAENVVACEHATVGTWVGMAYRPQQNDWHKHTIVISPTGTAAHHVEVWRQTAEPTDESPDFSTDLKSKVTMRKGKLRIADGEAQLWSYNPDRFDGVVEGNTFDAVGNDGHDALNRPYTFRRISCRNQGM